MDAEKVTIRPLSRDETKFLISLIESSKVVNNKTTNATSNKMKNEEWVRISESFNATTLCRRTPQQLRLKWENLKKNSRKRSTAIRMNSLKTGGGPPDYIPPDDILDRVSTLLGSTVDGFTVEVGGDAEPSDITIFGGDCDAGSILGAPGIFTESDETNGNLLEQEASTSSVTTPRLTKEKPFMNTPRASGFKRKLKVDDGRTARNLALAEYYSKKASILDAKLKKSIVDDKMEKSILDAKLESILLENQKLKLEIAKLKENT